MPIDKDAQSGEVKAANNDKDLEKFGKFIAKLSNFNPSFLILFQSTTRRITYFPLFSLHARSYFLFIISVGPVKSER